jgi:subtilisin family serine protease
VKREGVLRIAYYPKKALLRNTQSQCITHHVFQEERMKRKKMRLNFVTAALACLILLLWAAWGGRPTPAYGDGSAHYEINQIVVKLNSGATIADVNAGYGTTTLRTLINSAAIYLLEAPAGADAEQLVQAMHGDSRLLYAELNFIGRAPEANPSDTYAWPYNSALRQGETIPTESLESRLLYEWQWGGSDSAHYFNQPAVHAIRLSDGQAYSSGAGVTVAVLDTGVQLNHPVLVPHLSPVRYDFVDDDPAPNDSPNGLDDDGDGFIDEIAGHGTHVAGVIHLVAPQAQIMPLRVLDSDGQGNNFIVAEAMLYAAQHGADVINLSLGTSYESEFLLDVVRQVSAAGVVVVAAAGNQNLATPQYPAGSPCALAVTALDNGRLKADYANYGLWVDAAAPGEHLYSTFPTSGFAWWSGTSMSTPLVAGQAALIRSLNPSLSPAVVARFISGTAEAHNSPQYSGQLGAGLIDIGDSLASAAAGQLPANAPQPLAGCGS